VANIRVGLFAEEDRKKAEATMQALFRMWIVPELGDEGTLPIRESKEVVVSCSHLGTLNGSGFLRANIDADAFDKLMSKAMTKTSAITKEREGTPTATIWCRKLDEKKMFALVPQLEKIPAAIRKILLPTEAWLGLLDDQTLFVSLSGKTALVRALRARPTTTKPRTSEELTKLLRDNDPKDTTTITIMEDSLLPGLLLVVNAETRDAFEEFEHIRIRVRGKETIEMNLTMQGKSDDAAKNLEGKVKAGLDLAKRVVGDVVPEKDKREILAKVLGEMKLLRTMSQVNVMGSVNVEQARTLVKPPG
jgi:hypothetical protein